MGKKNNNKDGAEKKVVFTTHPETMADLFKGISGDESPPDPKAEQMIRVGIEKKGRGGKTVTLIHGLQSSDEEAEQLMKTLKKKCGVGGSLVEGEILLQGDVRDAVVKHMTKLGYSDCKKSGG